MSAPHQESDALGALEERIHKAIELVAQLRAEKDAAIQEAAAARAQAEKLGQEMQALRDERKHVRGRIEKLLGHIDQLSAG
jgi:FtsZ-binding cell division protein ZapB